MPKFSVITANLNRANLLERVIRNVLEQQVNSLEHLIIDGGSSDGSLALCEKYDHLKLISEPDKNVYDAFNKGIKNASGDILLFLNTDDLLSEGILVEVLDIFESDPNLDMVSCGAAFGQLDDILETKFQYLHRSILELQEMAMIRYPVLLNARFYRREFLERVGFFDDQYSTVSDRGFMLNCAFENPKNHILEKIAYHYGIHQGSLTHGPQRLGAGDALENLDFATDALISGEDSAEKKHRGVFRFWKAWSVLQLLFVVQDVGFNRRLTLFAKNCVTLFILSPILFRELFSHFRESKWKYPDFDYLGGR